MRVKELLESWQQAASAPQPVERLTLELDAHQAARLRALVEMFPGKRREDIAHDLLQSALQELEARLPYVPGDRVIGEDELGDPIFEDVGPAPTYHALTRKHLSHTGS